MGESAAQGPTSPWEQRVLALFHPVEEWWREGAPSLLLGLFIGDGAAVARRGRVSTGFAHGTDVDGEHGNSPLCGGVNACARVIGGFFMRNVY